MRYHYNLSVTPDGSHHSRCAPAENWSSIFSSSIPAHNLRRLLIDPILVLNIRLHGRESMISLNVLTNILCRFAILSALVGANSALSWEDKTGTSIKAVYINNDSLILVKIGGVSGWLELGTSEDSKAQAMMSIALAGKAANATDMWVRWEPSAQSYPRVTIMSMGY